MSRKKIRLGIKWLDGIIYDVAYITESSSGVVYGALKNDKHVTILKDTDSLSSHLTDQKKEQHQPLVRLQKKELPTKADITQAFFKFRRINEDEYNTKVIYISKKCSDALNTISESFVEREEGEYLHYFIDLPSMVEQITRLIEVIRENPSKYFGSCQIRDLLKHEGWIGIGERKQVVIQIDDELWELNPMFSLPFSSVENESVDNLLELIGYSSISKGLVTNLDKLKK